MRRPWWLVIPWRRRRRLAELRLSVYVRQWAGEGAFEDRLIYDAPTTLDPRAEVAPAIDWLELPGLDEWFAHPCQVRVSIRAVECRS